MMMETDNQDIKKQTIATKISFKRNTNVIGVSKMNSDEVYIAN